MTRTATLKPVFVEFIPDELSQGELYITVAYATAVHRCCCGCGREVVTPLSPTDWRLVFDGVSVSLEPSIGNWAFPCRSHYWVRRNRVVWAEAWSDARVALAREADREAKAGAYEDPSAVTAPAPVEGRQPPPPAAAMVEPDVSNAPAPPAPAPAQRLWGRLARWFRRGAD